MLIILHTKLGSLTKKKKEKKKKKKKKRLPNARGMMSMRVMNTIMIIYEIKLIINNYNIIMVHDTGELHDIVELNL